MTLAEKIARLRARSLSLSAIMVHPLVVGEFFAHDLSYAVLSERWRGLPKLIPVAFTHRS